MAKGVTRSTAAGRVRDSLTRPAAVVTRRVRLVARHRPGLAGVRGLVPPDPRGEVSRVWIIHSRVLRDQVRVGHGRIRAYLLAHTPRCDATASRAVKPVDM